MNLNSTYLGLELKNPIVCGSCPLGTNIDTIRSLEDAGAAAVVLPSLFEEEILGAVQAQMEMESAGAGFAEASSYMPNPDGYHVGPNDYLDHLPGRQGGRIDPDHRVAQRHDPRRLDRLRQEDGGRRRRRHRAQHLLPGHRTS